MYATSRHLPLLQRAEASVSLDLPRGELVADPVQQSTSTGRCRRQVRLLSITSLQYISHS